MPIRLLLFALFFLSVANAQNSVLLRNPDELKLPMDFNRFLPDSLKAEADANIWVKNTLNSFSRDHLFIFSNRDNPYFFLFPVHVHFRYWEEGFKNWDNNPFDFEGRFDRFKHFFFQNKGNYHKLYKALMPLFKNAVSEMTPLEAEELFILLNSGLEYAQHFELDRENAEEKALGEKFLHHKGNIKAFVYRRIRSGELSKEECIYWLSKIIKDLASVAKTGKSAEEHYILRKKLPGGDFFVAYQLNDVNESALIKRAKGKYSLLFSPYSVIMSSSFYDEKAAPAYFELAHPGGKKELVIFQSDAKLYQVPEIITLEGLNNEISIFNNFIKIGQIDQEPDFYYYRNQAKKRRLSKIYLEPEVRFLSYNSMFLSLQYPQKEFQTFLCVLPDSLVYLEAKDVVEKSINWPEDHDLALIVYEQGPPELISFKNKQLRVNLPDFLDNIDFMYSWKNWAIIENVFTENATAKYRRSFVYSYDGKAANADLEGLTKVFAHDSFNFALLKKDSLWAIFDTQFQAKSDFIYSLHRNPHLNAQIRSYNFNYPSYKTILSRFDSESITKALLLDKDGKIIIPERWPWIEERCLYDFCVYVVCDAVLLKSSQKLIPSGKFAIFDAAGKQLTEFVYDSVGTMDAEKVLTLHRDGKMERLKIGEHK